MENYAKNFGIVSVFSLFVVFLLLGSSSAWSYNDETVHSVTFPTISVTGNGQEYTNVTAIGYGWQGHFELNAGWNARVKNWKVWPRVKSLLLNGANYNQGNQTADFEVYAESKSYPWGKRPKNVDKTVGTTLPNIVVRNFAVGVCNEYANALRQQGKGNPYIFSQEHQVDIEASLMVNSTFTAGKMDFVEASPLTPNAKVICKKWAGSQIPTAGELKIDDSVKNATLLTIEQYGPGGLCMIKLSGVVETTFANTQVKFRYEHNEGKKSDIKTVTTDHTRKAFFWHQYKIPNNPDGDENGSVRMIGLPTNQFQSAWSDYSLQCVKPGATAFKTELPPVLSLDLEPQDNIMIKGQICPSRLRLKGTIEARSDLDGQMMFVGTYYFSKLHEVNQNNGQTKNYIDYRDLNWQSTGPLGLKTESNDPLPLKSQNFKLGFNLAKDGKIIASVAQKNFKVTCRHPKVSPAVAGGPGDLAVGVHVTQSSLSVSPQKSMLGKCAVKISGSVYTNVTNAKVKLAYRNHKGILSPSRTVTTNSQKQALFTDTLDFSKSGEGLWIDESGKIALNGGKQAGNYSGSFQMEIIGQDHKSNVASYDFNCVNPAPGGIAKNPKKPKPAFPPVGPLVGNPKPSSQQSMNSLATPTKVKSTSNGAQTASLIPRTIDVAATNLKISLPPGRRRAPGTTLGTIRNNGNTTVQASYSLQVKNRNGKSVGNKNGVIKLLPGAQLSVSAAFPSRRGGHYKATLKVSARGDSKRRNNSRQASANRPR